MVHGGGDPWSEELIGLCEVPPIGHGHRFATCVHCDQTVRFCESDSSAKAFKCPSCRRKSALGESGRKLTRADGSVFYHLGIMLILLWAGVSICNILIAHGDISENYFIYAVGLIPGIIFMSIGIKIRSISTSHISQLKFEPACAQSTLGTGVEVGSTSSSTQSQSQEAQNTLRAAPEFFRPNLTPTASVSVRSLTCGTEEQALFNT